MLMTPLAGYTVCWRGAEEGHFHSLVHVTGLTLGLGLVERFWGASSSHVSFSMKWEAGAISVGV
jgi:hypothetical protein